MDESLTLFYSYAHEDLSFREELDKHLAPMKAQGLSTTCYSTSPPGREWRTDVDQKIESAHIIVLLVSADYLGSDQCEAELRKAMTRHMAGTAAVIPVIIKHCNWKSSPLERLNLLPRNGKPIIDWEPRDSAWLHVSDGIRATIAEIKSKRYSKPSPYHPSHTPAYDVDRRLQFLRTSMLPLGRCLSQELQQPTFFLAIHPSRWEPMYCALPPHCANSEIAENIRRKCATLRESYAGSSLPIWQVFDHIARVFIKDAESDPNKTIAGATDILLSDAGLVMGHDTDIDGTAWQHTAFYMIPGKRRRTTRGWFQEALDLAGLFRFSVPNFSSRPRSSSEENFYELLLHPLDPEKAIALQVRNYMRRPGLLQDRFLILLAEYLLFKALNALTATNETPLRQVEPSQLTHFFVPLKSNGQWRTTACWLSDGKEALSGRSSEMFLRLQETLNARCSQLYLEGFAVTLLTELHQSSRTEEKGARALYKALSVLWWGRAFWFYRDNRLIWQVVLAEHDDEHHPDDQPKQQLSHPHTEGFFRVYRDEDMMSLIVIDLRATPGSRGQEVAKTLAVDLVAIRVQLFEIDGEMELNEIAEQLAERISLAIA